MVWFMFGVVLLVLVSGVGMFEVIGVFIVCGVLMVWVGVSGWFEMLMDCIFVVIVLVLLVGVFVKFGLDVVYSMCMLFGLVLVMVVVYLFGCCLWLCYVVFGVLVVGIVFVFG